MTRCLVFAITGALCAAVSSPARALDCTGVPQNLVPACGVADAGEASSWASNGSTGSARVTVICESTEDFVVLFDNAIARPGSTVPVELQAFAVE